MRAALYARYSSDRQDARSIADQLALCRARAEADGFTVVDEFADAAISGSAIANRPGLLGMLAAAESGAFSRVYAEDLDRLSRGQSDAARIFERLTFHDVEIVTLSDGAITEMHAGLKGTMNALFLKQLAAKTRRGQAGRVRAGRIAGGMAYGYRPVPGDPGARVVEEREADVVRRIFAAWLDGKSPRAIAAALNAEGVPGPRGRTWTASAINGSRARANGILNNETYAGVIVWNRQRFVKDPETGLRQARPNAPEQWMRADAPHLRIIDAETWTKVQERRQAAERPARPETTRRPKRLLSGLLKCACCGANYILHARDHVACSANRNRGTCNNNRQATMSAIEARVMDGLKQHLLDPEMLREAMAEYARERARLAKQALRQEGTVRRRLGEVTRELGRMVDAIAAGAQAAPLVERMNALERERVGLEAKLKEAETPAVELHPNAGEAYARRLDALQRALREGTASPQEIGTIRALVTEIIVTPLDAPGQVDLQIRGDLAALMMEPAEAARWLTVVAGARNSRKPALMPYTFLLPKAA